MKRLAFDLEEKDWMDWLLQRGEKPFRSKQIREWLFQKDENNPLFFTNLHLPLREALKADFDFDLPVADARLESKDGSEKFLLLSKDNQLFEMVIMPSDHRITLCVSSQVGCRMGCTFCQTGKLGFKRNLSRGEILSQIILANRRLKEKGLERKVTNVVFMGMGEPLDNYEEVVAACKTLIAKDAFHLSKSKVTISTSGLVPEIERLGKDLPVRLAISLHQTNDEKRSEIMPINRRYPLPVLKEALLNYPAPDRLGITFEYVMIKGVNDSLLDAKRLVHFLHGIKAKVNLIPMNRFPGSSMTTAEEDAVEQFQKYLSERSIPAPVRYSRAQDVSGACGQLAAKKQNELDMDPRVLAKERRIEEKFAKTTFGQKKSLE